MVGDSITAVLLCCDNSKMSAKTISTPIHIPSAIGQLLAFLN